MGKELYFKGMKLLLFEGGDDNGNAEKKMEGGGDREGKQTAYFEGEIALLGISLLHFNFY